MAPYWPRPYCRVTPYASVSLSRQRFLAPLTAPRSPLLGKLSAGQVDGKRRTRRCAAVETAGSPFRAVADANRGAVSAKAIVEEFARPLGSSSVLTFVQLASGQRCGFRVCSRINGGMTFVILNALSDVLVRPTYLVLPSRSNPCAETPGHQSGSVCCNDAVDERTRIPCRKQ